MSLIIGLSQESIACVAGRINKQYYCFAWDTFWQQIHNTKPSVKQHINFNLVFSKVTFLRGEGWAPITFSYLWGEWLFKMDAFEVGVLNRTSAVHVAG